VESGKPSSTYGEGRVCQWEGCDTPLSRYNPSCFCFAHQCAEEWEEPAEESAVSGWNGEQRRCGSCGRWKPLDTHNFARKRTKLRSICKECDNKRRKHSRRALGGDVVVAVLPNGRQLRLLV